jgi:hypothetical protein
MAQQDGCRDEGRAIQGVGERGRLGECSSDITQHRQTCDSWGSFLSTFSANLCVLFVYLTGDIEI